MHKVLWVDSDSSLRATMLLDAGINVTILSEVRPAIAAFESGDSFSCVITSSMTRSGRAERGLPSGLDLADSIVAQSERLGKELPLLAFVTTSADVDECRRHGFDIVAKYHRESCPNPRKFVQREVIRRLLSPPVAPPRNPSSRRVVWVGVAGASCSGKSCVSRELVRLLDCRLPPLQLDAFFLPKHRLPTHPIYRRNWELPAALDFQQFLAAMRMVHEKFLHPGRDVGLVSPVRGSPCAHRYVPFLRRYSTWFENGLATPLRDVEFVVVEGFLLFQNREVADMCDVHLWLDCPLEICRSRRIARDHCTQTWYDGLVWHHYLQFRDEQIRNMGQGAVQLDSTQSPAQIATEAFSAVEEFRKLHQL